MILPIKQKTRNKHLNKNLTYFKIYKKTKRFFGNLAATNLLLT